ncbi:MAG: hypothetical protein J6C34_03455 [Oscillospiraceae bacterium]|nr:hypothetical protein [Oscillospiraceae bacterium]MBQ8594884.1 hypothetical protein [Oscillospiraceae bacterium]
MKKTLIILLSMMLILMFVGCSAPEPVEEPSSEPESEISASKEEDYGDIPKSVYKNPMAEGYTFWGREEYSAGEIKIYDGRGKLECTKTSLFDSDGRIISEQLINSTGNISNWKYEYDSDGNCIFQEFEGYFNDEWQSVELKYEYENGLLKKQIKKDRITTTESVIINYYDSEDRLIKAEQFDEEKLVSEEIIAYCENSKKTEFFENGELVWERTEIFDSENRIIELVSEYIGIKTMEIRYEYDEWGNECKNIYYQNGNLVYDITTTYSGKDMPVFTKILYPENETGVKKFEYDENGKLIKKFTWSNTGSIFLSGWWEYEYDEKGNLIKEKGYGCWEDYPEKVIENEILKEIIPKAPGKTGNHDIYLYEYDENGTLISKTYYQLR